MLLLAELNSFCSDQVRHFIIKFNCHDLGDMG